MGYINIPLSGNMPRVNSLDGYLPWAGNTEIMSQLDRIAYLFAVVRYMSVRQAMVRTYFIITKRFMRSS